MATEDIRIMLVDDHALVRLALGEWLAREAGLAMVGSSGTADVAITMAMECRPDVIVMGTEMPGMICFDAGQMITALCPGVHMIYLSATVSDWLVDQALQAGASGHLTKSDPPEALIRAIRVVFSDGVYFSKRIRSRIADSDHGRGVGRGSRSRAGMLTHRELQVLEYVARAFSKKQIASTLSISVKTVDRHSCNLMRKLDIHDRVELTRFAIREGLVNPDRPGATELLSRWTPSASHRERSERSDRQRQMSGQIGVPAASSG